MPAKLPGYRKTRALLGYLLRADQPQRRDHLVDLLWDKGPNDPRGALRWSLGKLRPILDSGQEAVDCRPRGRVDRSDERFD